MVTATRSPPTGFGAPPLHAHTHASRTDDERGGLWVWGEIVGLIRIRTD
jgi:hypothetical protein